MAPTLTTIEAQHNAGNWWFAIYTMVMTNTIVVVVRERDEHTSERTTRAEETER